MSLREQLIMRDGKARPPALIPKICAHNSREPEKLSRRAYGDMSFDVDFYMGRREEIYNCIQCGYTLPVAVMMSLYQRFMLTGMAIVVGRNISLV